MPRYYGQYRQDQFVHQAFFPEVTDGFFVDIGANDGEHFSNSLAFEELGWQGVCVEPIPTVYEQLKARRRCTCVWAAVGRQPGTMPFLHVTGYAEMFSGLMAGIGPEHEARIDRYLAHYGGEKRVLDIPVKPFGDIVDRPVVDFLSIDVEGAELEILRAIDFQSVTIRTIALENNYEDPAIRQLLAQAGFVLWGRLGVDDLYVLKPFLAEVEARYGQAHLRRAHARAKGSLAGWVNRQRFRFRDGVGATLRYTADKWLVKLGLKAGPKARL